jgi:hypothetical protein
MSFAKYLDGFSGRLAYPATALGRLKVGHVAECPFERAIAAVGEARSPAFGRAAGAVAAAAARSPGLSGAEQDRRSFRVAAIVVPLGTSPRGELRGNDPVGDQIEWHEHGRHQRKRKILHCR